MAKPPPTLAVVVPVGPGDGVSAAMLQALAALPQVAEVCISCCRPADADAAQAQLTAATPAGRGWRVRLAPAGRAAQQNAGAAATRGDWLWCLHADSRLLPGTDVALARFLARGRDAIGYFDLRFADDGPAAMRLNALGAWWRSRLLGLPFGDQGLLLPRAWFERLGGFDVAVPRGEDHDLVWRARRAGLPVRPVGAALQTSARRYAEQGWWRTTREHQRETWRQARTFARPRTPPRTAP